MVAFMQCCAEAALELGIKEPAKFVPMGDLAYDLCATIRQKYQRL